MGVQEDLRVAVCCGAQEAVQRALDEGARVDVENSGWWPVHSASSMGHLGVVKLLLEGRANLHQVTTRLHRQPLHLAALEGHGELVDFLVENQADMEAGDIHRRTPLSLACQKGHLQVVKLLSTLGADVVCPDEAEATAYDWAMQGLSYLGEKYSTYEDILELLQRKGAQVQGKNLGPMDRCPYPSSRGPANC